MSQGSDDRGWHPSSASIWYVNLWTWGEVVQMLMTASHATSTVTELSCRVGQALCQVFSVHACGKIQCKTDGF